MNTLFFQYHVLKRFSLLRLTLLTMLSNIKWLKLSSHGETFDFITCSTGLVRATVLVRVYVAIIKHHDQKHVGEENIVISSSKEVMTGTETGQKPEDRT